MENTLEWTKTPTTTGYYWINQYGDVSIVHISGNFEGNGEPFYVWFGDGKDRLLSELSDYEWMGPLEKPYPPEPYHPSKRIR